MTRIPYSVLDLSPICAGQSASQAFANTLDLAQHAETWGYNRFWLAEHHNMTGIASAATSVVIAHVAGGTKTIRVGAGGIMLPNHAPLVIAEQFGTLESLYPNRIDLGLGRAPGTDPLTTYALRRTSRGKTDSFPQDVQELQMYFDDVQPGQKVQSVPGAGLHIPIWLLGSSLYSAQLAAALGLPFAFASHFAPALLMPALQVYREHFQPSSTLSKPYAMVAVNVFAADTDEAAGRLFSSLQQQFINLRRGTPGPLQPPSESQNDWSEGEIEGVEHALACSFVGSSQKVQSGLQTFLAATDADELLISGHIFDQTARLRSFELASEICRAIGENALTAAR